MPAAMQAAALVDLVDFQLELSYFFLVIPCPHDWAQSRPLLWLAASFLCSSVPLDGLTQAFGSFHHYMLCRL